jgi:hypothetical protein
MATALASSLGENDSSCFNNEGHCRQPPSSSNNCIVCACCWQHVWLQTPALLRPCADHVPQPTLLPAAGPSGSPREGIACGHSHSSRTLGDVSSPKPLPQCAHRSQAAPLPGTQPRCICRPSPLGSSGLARRGHQATRSFHEVVDKVGQLQHQLEGDCWKFRMRTCQHTALRHRAYVPCDVHQDVSQ